MRLAVLSLLLLGCTLLGATCLPLYEQPSDEPPAATELGVTIDTPAQDATIPQDTVLTIRWTAFNTSGQAATATLYVESRTDLTQTMLVEDLAVTGTLSQQTAWDTSGLSGAEYAIYAQITAGTTQRTAEAAGRITIDSAPTFEFTQPATDATYTQEGDALTIAWTALETEDEGEFAIGLDADDDPESGNEIFIHEGTIDDDDTEEEFAWSGDDLLGDAVPVGTYQLFALVSDTENPERAVSSAVTITVVPDPGGSTDPVELSIIEPADDVTFLASDDDLVIEYGVNEFDDVLIDLKIDTDDDHANGNEQTILAQKLVAGGTETETFDWDGTLSSGDPADDGIYRLFILLNTGSGSAQTAEGEGLVFRRSLEDQPLIALLEPAAAVTLEAGGTLSLEWRDDDPNEEATIRLTLDDDATPDEGEDGSDPEDQAEREIASDLNAAADAVQDTLLWQVPGDLAPGTYYIFAYITSTDPVSEQVSVAPGTLIIDDPAGSP